MEIFFYHKQIFFFEKSTAKKDFLNLRIKKRQPISRLFFNLPKLNVFGS